MKRTLAAVVTTLAAAAVPVMTPTNALADERPTAGRATGPTVTVTAPANKVEGDRFKVTVRIGAARKATTLSLQKQVENIYRQLEWSTVRTLKTAGRARVQVPSVADELSKDRFRAVVRYTDGRSVMSKPAAVTVWHWYDLHRFPEYYETDGVLNSDLFSFAMNGDEWIGWYTYGAHEMWEARYTPGRNCKAFRGVAGVQDQSSDGSTGEITLVADETEIVYTSPELSPGMVAPFEISLDRPYRFAIQARDTSPEGAYAAPAIGAAQFLCHY
jgi:hypothetical protein